MVRVLRHYNPPAGSNEMTPSDALECPNCKSITWAWCSADWAACKLCATRFYSRDGAWHLRGELPPKEKPTTPEE